jgi:hypothetical protein
MEGICSGMSRTLPTFVDRAALQRGAQVAFNIRLSRHKAALEAFDLTLV